MGGTDPALAYHEYLGPALFVPMAQLTLQAAQPRPGEHVLDVACGTGIVTAQFAPIVGGTGRVVGLDASAAMLAVAAARPRPEGCAIEWKEGNGMAMDLPDASFDLVTCQHGLQFFSDRRAGAREMRRVLAPGGRAVVACWQGLAQQLLFGSLVRAQMRHLGATEAQVGAPFSLGDAGELRGLLLDAGFTRVEVQVHVVEARFPQPERFLRTTAIAAAATMPEKFAGVALDPLVAAIAAELSEELVRYRDGDVLRFPAPAHLAIAS